MNMFDPRTLERWTASIFDICGVPSDHAGEAAKVLVRTEMRNYKTHGLMRLPSYVERLQAGDFNPRPQMRHRTRLGGIVFDADGAMGQVAGPHAVRLGLEALETSASVFIAVQSCGHLGALGIHSLLAAEAGAFCFVGQRTPPLLGMAGFSYAAIGHNPLSFACPLRGADPIVFDIACSVAARGRILQAAHEHRSIPDEWALDEAGVVTTDPQRALGGMLLPMGGHKGIGIAMMVECLAGALGASESALAPERNLIREGGAVGRQGAFVWMIKPEAFADEEYFSQYMTQWTERYVTAAPEQARLPGNRAGAMEAAARRHGVALRVETERELTQLGASLGAPFPARLATSPA